VLAVTEGDTVTGIAPEPVSWQTLDVDRDLLAVQQDNVQVVGLAASREIVRQALRLLRTGGHRGLADLSEQLPELLLSLSPAVADMLIERVFGALDAHPDLTATLRTMLEEDLDRARAASAMHIHRNTLLYRLARIEELTGLDLRRPRDLAIAYLAARTRDR
jgi:DNA-binding PucR family transcriptional regulator